MAELEPQLELPPSLACMSLRERINYWNDRLDTMPFEAVNEATLDLIATDLDTLWEYQDTPCLLRGYGQRGFIEGGVYHEQDEDFIEAEEGWCGGFVVAAFGRTLRRWRVAYWFDKEDESETVDDLPSRHILLHANWASIVPIAAIEEPLQKIDAELQDDLHGALSERSEEFAELLRDPQFFQLSCDEQKYFVNHSILEAEKETMQRGGIKRPVLLEGEHAYVWSREGKTACFQKLDISEDVVWGNCLGLDSLIGDQLRAGSKVQDEQALHDGSAGLCLVVEFQSKASSSLPVENGAILYVPISGQEIGVTFSPDRLLASYL